MISGPFPPERTGIWLEDTGKIQRFSGPECCFQAPLISGAFPPDSAHTLRPGHVMFIEVLLLSYLLKKTFF